MRPKKYLEIKKIKEKEWIKKKIKEEKKKECYEDHIKQNIFNMGVFIVYPPILATGSGPGAGPKRNPWKTSDIALSSKPHSPKDWGFLKTKGETYSVTKKKIVSSRLMSPASKERDQGANTSTAAGPRLFERDWRKIKLFWSVLFWSGIIWLYYDWDMVWLVNYWQSLDNL